MPGNLDVDIDPLPRPPDEPLVPIQLLCGAIAADLGLASNNAVRLQFADPPQALHGDCPSGDLLCRASIEAHVATPEWGLDGRFIALAHLSLKGELPYHLRELNLSAFNVEVVLSSAVPDTHRSARHVGDGLPFSVGRYAKFSYRHDSIPRAAVRLYTLDDSVELGFNIDPERVKLHPLKKLDVIVCRRSIQTFAPSSG